jgi:hypothetical protein
VTSSLRSFAFYELDLTFTRRRNEVSGYAYLIFKEEIKSRCYKDSPQLIAIQQGFSVQMIFFLVFPHFPAALKDFAAYVTDGNLVQRFRTSSVSTVIIGNTSSEEITRQFLIEQDNIQ